jgi:GntR family transcriptional regulator, transcriptional repressor for pyruvate dehydrogenase complex
MNNKKVHAMEFIKPVRISDRITELLIKVISDEKFKTGDKFYSENELVARLGVSRSSIREAMRSLEVTGWVTVKQGKGVFVASAVDKSGEGFLEWVKDNRNSLLEHFEVRLMLDPKAAAYAARNASESEINELKGICAEFKEKAEVNDTEELISIDERFHFMIAKSTKNRTLFVLMKTMARSLPVGWITSLRVPGRISKTIIEHSAIIDAIAMHDEKKAENVMHKHLANAKREILELAERNQNGNKDNNTD